MTVFEITLTTNPHNIAADFELSINVPDESYSDSPSFVFRTTPTLPNHIQIGATREISAINMFNKLTEYFEPQDFIVVEQTLNGAKVFIDGEGEFSYSFVFPSGDINISISTFTNEITTTGMDEDGYLINNEIWVQISAFFPTDYFTISFKNNSNGNQSSNFMSSAFNDSTRINLSPVLKSMFDYPNVRNDNNFTITITDSNNHTLSISKTFIRGGNRTQETNQTLQAGTILRPSVKLPIWDGYPTAEYYLDGSFVIQQRPIAEVSAALKDYRRVKGCNNIYFRFSNQKGGYSNWLFEAYGETENGGSEGAYIRNNELEDFGGETDSVINIYSKIPSEYIELVRDLIVSPEIYIYKDAEFIRITALKNSIEQDNSKRAYTVRLKFDMNYRFNPEVIW